MFVFPLSFQFLRSAQSVPPILFFRANPDLKPSVILSSLQP
jgi:hypothetical protein